MHYRITVEPDYLRAQLLDKETVDEMLEFFDTVARESDAHERTAILLDIRSSRAIFHVGARRLFEYFTALTDGASYRIALLGDSRELQLSHDYLALLARQQRMNVESFRDEAAAIKWLTNGHDTGERRAQADRRHRFASHFPEQRSHNDRRGDPTGEPGAQSPRG